MPVTIDVSQIESWVAIIGGILSVGGILFAGKVRAFFAKPFIAIGKTLTHSNINTKLDSIMKELKPNGGSTLRDAIQRLESRQGMLTAKFIAMLDQPNNPPTFETDAAGRCTWASSSYLSMIGRSFDEISGYGWTNAIHLDDLENVRDEWNLAVEQKRTFEYVYRFRHTSGASIKVSTRAIPTVVQSEIVGYMGFITILNHKKPIANVNLTNVGGI